MFAAVEEDVSDSLTSLSTAAAGASNSRDVSIEEKVVESDLLGSQLHQQRALTFAEPLVELQHLLSGRWRVSVCRATFLVFSPCTDSLSLCLDFAPSAERRSEWI